MHNPKLDPQILAGIDPQKSSNAKIFLFLLRLLKPVWHIYLLMLLLITIGAMLAPDALFYPRVNKTLIDNVFPRLPFQDWGAIRLIVLITIAFIAFDKSTNTLLDFLKYIVSFRVGMNLGMSAFRRLHGQSLASIEKRPVGEHLYRVGTNFDPQAASWAFIALAFGQYGTATAENSPRIGNDIDAVLNMVTQVIEMILRTATRFILISGVVSLMIGPEVGAALLIFVIPYLFGVHYMYGLQRRTEMRLRHLSENYLAEMQRSLAGIRTVKAYGKTRFHQLRYVEKFILVCRRQGRYYLLKLVTDNYMICAQWLFQAGAYYYVLAHLHVSLGTWVALYGFMGALFGPIENAVRVIEGVRIQMVAVRRLIETLSMRNDMWMSDNPVPMPLTHGPITLHQVDFSYIPDFPILRKADLVLHPRRKTVIVGPSGSGKSSLVNLVLRFYDPEKGQVSVNGTDLRSVELSRYYDNIGMILQDDYLFTGTIRENVRYGKRFASQEEVEWACRVAGIHDEILEMPDGYDTMVAEGSGLSGGQIQRVALARAFVRKPRILILDEATRALDARLHRLVLENIDREFSDATRIMITHATRDARNADEVVYIERGSVKERGNYADLMALNGAFASMVKAEDGYDHRADREAEGIA